MTNDTRAAFEAWAKQNIWMQPYSLYLTVGSDGYYASARCRAGWDSWLASRRAALEEAAKVCEKLNPNKAEFTDFDGGFESGIEACAAAIRALGEGQS